MLWYLFQHLKTNERYFEFVRDFQIFVKCFINVFFTRSVLSQTIIKQMYRTAVHSNFAIDFCFAYFIFCIRFYNLDTTCKFVCDLRTEIKYMVTTPTFIYSFRFASTSFHIIRTIHLHYYLICFHIFILYIFISYLRTHITLIFIHMGKQ